MVHNMEMEDFFEKEFFIIDSNNLDEVKSKLYGYMIKDTEIIQNDNFNNAIDLSSGGAYVLIAEEEDSITIRQDFNGSYGIYVYSNDDHFAISNSFLRLVNHLKFSQNLSFNKNYADSFLYANLAAVGYMDTLVNEIKAIPRHYVISIDKKSKKISYDKIDYEEMTVPVDSESAFEIIDRWHDKWVNIIRSIKEKTNAISVDLSGGFDSRVMACLWINANIDFDKVRIKSHEHLEEDFKIATKIADFFNFKLNQPLLLEKPTFKFSEIYAPLNNSFDLKLGFHKQMYFKSFRTGETVYSITGEGGGSLRHFAKQDSKSYLKQRENLIGKYNPSLFESAKVDIERALGQVMDNFDLDENSDVLIQMHYNETRSRYHYGKAAVESYFSNMITLAPLIDEDLRKLKYISEEFDDKLLISIIFLRFCPELLNFEFDNGRKIDSKTIEYAKVLNEKYPYKPRELSFVSGPEIKEAQPRSESNGRYVSRDEINAFLAEAFYSNKFQTEFEKHYSFRDYLSIMKFIETADRQPLTHVYSAMAIVTVAKAVEFSNEINYKQKYGWLNDCIDGNPKDNTQRLFRALTEIYYTSRIDIKNKGHGNSVEIFDVSDNLAKITYPEWIKDETGNGCVILSSKGSMSFKVKCINDGEVSVKLKGKLLKDKNGMEFPVYIDMTEFKVNEESVLDGNKLVSRSQPYEYTKTVQDGDIIAIEVSWSPVTSSSEYELDYNLMDYDKFNYDKIKYDKLNYDKLNYNKLNYDELNYNKLNYDKLNYNKLNYDKLDYDNVNYEKIDYAKLSYKKLNSKRLVKSKTIKTFNRLKK